MKSMTGYGRGECARDGFKVTVELSSVNRKSGEITLNLPRDLESLEAQVRDEINKRISRGRLNVRVAVHEGEDAGAVAQVNTALAKAYAAELAKLATELNLSGGVRLSDVLRAGGGCGEVGRGIVLARCAGCGATGAGRAREDA